TVSVVGTGGFLENASQRLPVHASMPIVGPQALGQVPLGKQNGRTVRIADVARMTYGHPPLIGDAVVDNGPGLLMVIEKFPGANTVAVTQGIDHAFDEMRPGLSGIHIDKHIFRPATFIQLAIHNLTLAVIIGCVLVVLVLVAFLLEWRAAFISLVTIPLSLVAATIVLDLRGTTINTLVLAGFAVAVGVVVDDAIIDTENIVRRLRVRRERGSPIAIAPLILAASLEVRSAILYATLINVLAVLPGLGQDLFPTFKERGFLMHWITKPGTSLPEQVRSITSASRQIRAVPGVDHFGSHIGQAFLGEEIAGSNFGENWVSMSPNADYGKTLGAIRRIENENPGISHDVQTYLRERIDEVLAGSTEAVVVRIFG